MHCIGIEKKGSLFDSQDCTQFPAMGKHLTASREIYY